MNKRIAKKIIMEYYDPEADLLRIMYYKLFKNLKGITGCKYNRRQIDKAHKVLKYTTYWKDKIKL